MNIPRIFLVTLALVALTVGLRNTRVQAAANLIPSVGQMAPNFTLPSQEGTKISLDQFQGRWVVLYFYPKDQTQGCTVEARHFQRDMARYRALRAVVLGVSVDSVRSHHAFCSKDRLHFKLLADQDKTVAAAYGSLSNYMGFRFAKRNTFLINPQGMIVKEWIGVDPSNHSAEVLAALHEMHEKS